MIEGNEEGRDWGREGGYSRCAIRDESINSCSMAIVFTNRPIRKGEKITLKVVEVSIIMMK